MLNHTHRLSLQCGRGSGRRICSRVEGSTQLHRSVPDHFDGPLDLEQVRRLTFPRLQVSLTESVFNGTIYFVQVDFRSQVQPTATVPTADMGTAITYAMTAMPQLTAYTRQYGPITITINPT